VSCFCTGGVGAGYDRKSKSLFGLGMKSKFCLGCWSDRRAQREDCMYVNTRMFKEKPYCYFLKGVVFRFRHFLTSKVRFVLCRDAIVWL
jgi:hypothetical protein